MRQHTNNASVSYVFIRDGLKESLVITKTFQVDEAGLPGDNLDDTALGSDWLDTNRNENDFKPIISQLGPKTTAKRKVYKVLVFLIENLRCVADFLKCPIR